MNLKKNLRFVALLLTFSMAAGSVRTISVRATEIDSQDTETTVEESLEGSTESTPELEDENTEEKLSIQDEADSVVSTTSSQETGVDEENETSAPDNIDEMNAETLDNEDISIDEEEQEYEESKGKAEAGADNVIDSGSCGESATWVLTGVDDNLTLTISGSGKMNDYWSSGTTMNPWISKNYEIKTIIVEDGITSIGDYAFYELHSVTSISIPDGVVEIGERAFEECDKLSNIIIPESVMNIGEGAFCDCDSLTEVVLPKNITIIKMETFCSCSSLKHIAIPNGVKSIEEGAFKYCENLTSVTIPDGVTKIGVLAFDSCTSITEINLPESITEIGHSAFSSCTSLISISLPNNLTHIEESTFNHCSSLKSIAIPESITEIDSYAFSFCSSLMSITIPGGVKEIKSDTFEYCEKLKNAVISEGVISISDSAFQNCESLEEISLPNSLKSIGGNVFSGCSSLKSVTIPGSVKEIDDVVFYYCTNLTSVKLEEGVEHIGHSFLAECTKLESIVIPSSVTSIGDQFFWNCSSLTEIYFQGEAPSIGSDVFHNVTATAYYPVDDPTWTDEVRQDYGGKITWVEWNPYSDSLEYNTYRADYYLSHQSGTIEPLLFEVSPSTKIYKTGLKNNMFVSTNLWNELTNLLDAADDPSSIPKSTMEKSDVYAGLIMAMINPSDNSNYIDAVNKECLGLTNSFFGDVKEFMKLQNNIQLTKDYDFSSLTQVQRENLIDWSNKWMKDHTPGWNATDKFSAGMEVFNYIKEANDFCKYYSSVYTIRGMGNSYAFIINEMYKQCPESNKDLKLALKKCATLLNAGAKEMNTILLKDVVYNVRTNVGKFGVSKLWDSIKADAVVSCPEVAALWASYKNAKFICNTLLSTDETCEKYFTMEAIMKLEEIANKVYEKNKQSYLKTSTSKDAEILMDTVDILFQLFDKDCETAYAFVDTVDSSLQSKVSRWFETSNADTLKDRIKSMQNDMAFMHRCVLVDWTSQLQDDYPDLYAEYSKLFLKNIDNCKITGISSKTYTGKPITQTLTVKDGATDLILYKDYTVSYVNNTNAGTAKITITGMGVYTGKKEKTFAIKARKITPVVTLNKTLSVYNGKINKPLVTVKNGKTKLAASNYTIKYPSGCKNPGTYKVLVVLKGNYSGSGSAYFKINPKGTVLSSLTSASKMMNVKWKKQAVQTSGYQIEYATNQKFTSNKKTITIKGTNTTGKTIKGLKGGKTYFVRVRTFKTTKGKLFSAWSAPKKVKIKK